MQKIDPRAHHALHVEIVAVEMSGREYSPGTQGLELSLDGADTRGGARVVPKRRRVMLGLDRRDEHTSMRGQVLACPHVPFGIGKDIGKRLAVHVLGGEVEMQLEPRRGGLADLAEADFVLVVGGLAGAVVVIVLDPAVEVDELGPSGSPRTCAG